MLTVEEIRANNFEIRIRGWDGEDMEYSHYGRSSMVDLIAGLCYRCGENLMLWTGQKDIDGKEIYSKDILQLFDIGSDRAIDGSICRYVDTNKPSEILLVIQGSDCKLYRTNGKEAELISRQFGQFCRVIGNIYDSPELWQGNQEGALYADR